ncbi:hypothetical protein [uncultured Paracoccus sp.]|uniref:hypothetical protein n=1 Tax=uncultured Paracoccus sp. TaxID=189685 RepID=UPI0025E5559B|nr:hypothetical protein [uncultured Paracoccus sp.]
MRIADQMDSAENAMKSQPNGRGQQPQVIRPDDGHYLIGALFENRHRDDDEGGGVQTGKAHPIAPIGDAA